MTFGFFLREPKNPSSSSNTRTISASLFRVEHCCTIMEGSAGGGRLSKKALKRFLFGDLLEADQSYYFWVVLIIFGLGFAYFSVHAGLPPPQPPGLPLLQIGPSVVGGVFTAVLGSVGIAARARHAGTRRMRVMFFGALASLYLLVAAFVVASYTPPLGWFDVVFGVGITIFIVLCLAATQAAPRGSQIVDDFGKSKA